jgi:hypothetical protein
MARTAPLPVCKAFLICRQIKPPHLELIGQNNIYQNDRWPNGPTLGFFARLTGGHGEYTIEVQLQDMAGDVFWRNGPEWKWRPQSPLDTLEMGIHLNVVLPGPGNYSLVLTANGEELCREPYFARLPAPAVSP